LPETKRPAWKPRQVFCFIGGSLLIVGPPPILGDPAFASRKALLYFGDRNGLYLTYFNAAITSQAFIGTNRNGLAVLKFIDIHRTDLYTFFIPHALIMVYFNLEHNYFFFLAFEIFKGMPPFGLYLKKKGGGCQGKKPRLFQSLAFMSGRSG
jgi:hypothetical protein